MLKPGGMLADGHHPINDPWEALLMTKTYVLDTNVLIQAPHALHSFEDNHVVIPVAVLEELDRFKNEEGERGANTRQVIRCLEQLRLEGSLTEGIPLQQGGSIRLELNHKNVELPNGFDMNSSDNRILKVCKGMINEGHQATLVTHDVLVRIKAQLIGIPAEEFTTDQVPAPERQYTGRAMVYAPDLKVNSFKKTGIQQNELYTVDEKGTPEKVVPVLNQFFTVQSELSEKKTLLGKFDGNAIIPLRHQNEHPFGVTPRNLGQYFLQEALMEDAKKVPLVIVKGPAGTAKTFYALAVGLHKIYTETSSYRRILISRPNVQFDDDIGFLPGSEQEKIAPFMRPIIDNLEILVDRDEKERYRNEKELRDKIDELFDRGVIVAEAMNFIRGRSLTHTYLIIDEAQNLTPKQVKGIITRVGKGTKVVLLGDPQQIDHPLLDETTNGLSYASERMKGSPYCCQITMQQDECERSRLALDASERM
jgi:PhoH-like ATPase